MGTATRRTPKRSVSAPTATVERHNAAVPARFAAWVASGAMWNTFCRKVGVIRMTTTIAAVSAHVLATDASTERRCALRTERRGNSLDAAARARIDSKTGV